MGKVTIKDVAKEAGVSITTVSHALNGFTDVSEETRKRIKEMANRMNYVPNPAGRSLGGIPRKSIALLKIGKMLPYDITNMVYNIISGIYEVASNNEYEFSMIPTQNAQERGLNLTKLCAQQDLKGIVVFGLDARDPYYEEIKHLQIPSVFIDCNFQSNTNTTITIDNTAAAKDVIRYLYGKGHRKIAFVNGSPEAEISQKRYNGYVEELRSLDLCVNEDYVITSNFSEELSYKKGKEFLLAHPEVTAIFCASDIMAFGVIKAAKELGRCIPKDLAIVGFDDIPTAKYVEGGLTTIAQDAYLMGVESTKVLLQIINGEKMPPEIFLNYELKIRNTA